jgi:hypothetical protein
MSKHKYRTAEKALSAAALETIAGMKTEDFVRHLKHHGIASLDDLAKASIGAAKSGIAGGVVAFDPEDFPVCYKFTVRPGIRNAEDLVTVLDKVKAADIGH